MKNRGFTLIELLVVIAIISILAAILVPNIARYMARANATKAHTDIKAIELELSKMLADTGKSNFGQFFVNAAGFTPGDVFSVGSDPATKLPALATAQQFYSEAFYRLLRQGRNANFNDSDSFGGWKLRDDVKQKLGNSYLDLQKDPWDKQYRFFAGPWPPRTSRASITMPIPFRCAVPQNADPDTGLYPVYVNTKDEDHGKANFEFNSGIKVDILPAPQDELPGKPTPDERMGYPAPKDLPVYVWSTGQDQMSGALIGAAVDQYEFYGDSTQRSWGGGDDVNNWDKNAGWSAFYGG